jgi:hypothetical protein
MDTSSGVASVSTASSNVVLLFQLTLHPQQPHGQAGFHVVAGHVDRSNQVETTRADVLQV